MFYLSSYFTLINIATPIIWVIIIWFRFNITTSIFIINSIEQFTKIFSVMVPYLHILMWFQSLWMDFLFLFKYLVWPLLILQTQLPLIVNKYQSFYIFAAVYVVVSVAGCLFCSWSCRINISANLERIGGWKTVLWSDQISTLGRSNINVYNVDMNPISQTISAIDHLHFFVGFANIRWTLIIIILYRFWLLVA